MVLRPWWIVAASLAVLPAAASGVDEVVGSRPRVWEVGEWLNSPGLTLDELRGRVVLVRWWTGPGCPFCKRSAAALNALHRDLSADGLVVVGLYHHKSARPLETASVHALARELGFRFPVAIDRGWTTLRAWWLDGGDRRWTSVTFALGRDGRVRWIHPGGDYPLGSGEYRELRRVVAALLAEPAAGG